MTYEAVDHRDQQTGDIGPAFEDMHWDQWIFCDVLLAPDECKREQRSKDNKTDDCWRLPRENRSTKIQTE